jgi:hypothetical protein
MCALGFVSVLALACGACRSTAPTPALNEVHRTKSGAMDIVVLSSGEALRQGRGAFTVEFRSTVDQRLVDVGTVKVSATMPMAGMPPMIAEVTVKPTDVAGRYFVDSNFTMVGAWRIGFEWNGPAGAGSASLQGRVQ